MTGDGNFCIFGVQKPSVKNNALYIETSRALPAAKSWRILSGFSNHQAPLFLLFSRVDMQHRRLLLKCQVKHKMSIFMSETSEVLLLLNKALTPPTSTVSQSTSC